MNCVCLWVVGEQSFSLKHCLRATGVFLYQWLYAKEPGVVWSCVDVLLALFIWR